MFSRPTRKSGVTYSQRYLWFEAARHAGYKWHEFQELEGDEQAEIVAAYLIDRQIAAVLDYSPGKGR